jgi:hypothetical protein
MSTVTPSLTLNRWAGMPVGDIWPSYYGDLMGKLQEAIGRKPNTSARRIVSGSMHGTQENDVRGRLPVKDDGVV